MVKNNAVMRSGYLYGPKTKQGFLRMKRMGIPRPLFSIQDRLAKVLQKHYKSFVLRLVKEMKAAAVPVNVTFDSAPLVLDTEEELNSFMSEMWRDITNEQDQVSARANAMSLENTLEHQWLNGDEPEVGEDLKADIEKSFKKEQSDYLKRLFEDADGTTRLRLDTFAIDKRRFFNDNMEAVRTLYIDNSLERIKGEEELLKRKMLKRILDYALGKSDTLNLADITSYAFKRGEHMARLFARDQMQRFNKACTIATFKSAGVTKVKWITTHDQRVRETHKALDGQIFDVNNLPPEVDDYNCRCGLVPVEWNDD